MVLLALCLRPAMTSVGPLIPRMGDDLGLGQAALGLLGAIPLFAFAVVSPGVHLVSRRFGIEHTILVALVVLASGTVVRSYGGTGGLWLGTVALGCALAFGNVLAPALIRRDLPGRITVAHGVYAGAMGGAAGTASLVAVPVADVAGWRFALAFWAVLFGVAAALWLLRLRHDDPGSVPADDPGGTGSVWRQPAAWVLTAFFGTQAAIFHSMVTWLPTVLVARGASEHHGGVQLFVYQWVGVGTGLLVPLVMRRADSQVVATLGAAVPVATGLVGLLLVPGLTTVWVCLVGGGCGMTVVVALGLAGFRSRDHHVMAQLVGMMQAAGYFSAGVAPVLMGFVAELTGSWTVPLGLLVLLAVGMLASAVPAGRPG